MCSTHKSTFTVVYSFQVSQSEQTTAKQLMIQIKVRNRDKEWRVEKNSMPNRANKRNEMPMVRVTRWKQRVAIFTGSLLKPLSPFRYNEIKSKRRSRFILASAMAFSLNFHVRNRQRCICGKIALTNPVLSVWNNIKVTESYRRHESYNDECVNDEYLIIKELREWERRVYIWKKNRNVWNNFDHIKKKIIST